MKYLAYGLSLLALGVLLTKSLTADTARHDHAHMALSLAWQPGQVHVGAQLGSGRFSLSF